MQGLVALGLPTSGKRSWNVFASSVNALLILGLLDVVYDGPVLYASLDLSFTRVSHVSVATAKILVREADVSKLPLWLSYHAVLEDPGLVDPLQTKSSNSRCLTSSLRPCTNAS